MDISYELTDLTVQIIEFEKGLFLIHNIQAFIFIF
jgi:hypothetical protein